MIAVRSCLRASAPYYAKSVPKSISGRENYKKRRFDRSGCQLAD